MRKQPRKTQKPETETVVNARSETIFEEAERIIMQDREQTHGDPAKNIARVAELWTVYLQKNLREVLRKELGDILNNVDDAFLRTVTERIDLNLTVVDVCRMMQNLKHARFENTPSRDNIVDDLGYGGLISRVVKVV